MRPRTPFAIDRPLPARLGRVLDLWRELLRGAAEMPFADDVDILKLEAVCPNLFLLGVFDHPRRFRLDLARTADAPEVNGVVGRFLDEVDLPRSLAFLRSQADATVEGAAPTVFEYGGRDGRDGRRFGRLLAPAWCDGRISLLVGALEFL